MAESQLRDEKQLFEFETRRDDLLAERREVVLVGVADFLNQAMEGRRLKVTLKEQGLRRRWASTR